MRGLAPVTSQALARLSIASFKPSNLIRRAGFLMFVGTESVGHFAKK
jgi:hypothetical protein